MTELSHPGVKAPRPLFKCDLIVCPAEKNVNVIKIRYREAKKGAAVASLPCTLFCTILYPVFIYRRRGFMS
jgi:hypothetical protein